MHWSKIMDKNSAPAQLKEYFTYLGETDFGWFILEPVPEVQERQKTLKKLIADLEDEWKRRVKFHQFEKALQLRPRARLLYSAHKQLELLRNPDFKEPQNISPEEDGKQGATYIKNNHPIPALKLLASRKKEDDSQVRKAFLSALSDVEPLRMGGLLYAWTNARKTRIGNLAYKAFILVIMVSLAWGAMSYFGNVPTTQEPPPISVDSSSTPTSTPTATATVTSTPTSPVEPDVVQGVSSTPTNVTPTWTLTTEIVIPTNTPTETPSPSVTPTATFTATGIACEGENTAEFLKDVSYPDDTEVKPNEPLTKTWQIKNTGPCIWDGSYKIVHVEGEKFGYSARVSFADVIERKVVQPGETVDISLGLTAPNIANNYSGKWNLLDASDKFVTDLTLVINVINQ